MKKLLSVAMAGIAGVACFGLAAGCAPQENLAVGKEVVKFTSQLDTLTQLKNGSVDAAIIDSVMAGYYTSKGDYSNDLQVVNELVFAEEEYGIAGRIEDKAFVSEINDALIALRTTKYMETAQNFGLETEMAIKEDTVNPITSATDNSWERIKKSGKIIIGYTVFAPIAFTQEGNLTGFDIELARSVVEYLNDTYTLTLKIEFQEIDWNSKEVLLQNGTVDLLWNGFTITEERAEKMSMTIPYLYNKQVAVVRKSDKDKYTTKESFSQAIIGVESGSAGEDVVYGK